MANEHDNRPKHRPNYSSTLCLCLLSSLGVCLAFLPYIPLSIDSKRDTIFTVAKIIMTMVILVVEFFLIRFIRYKERFHQAQLIFWPNRCQHCARVLGNMRPNPASQSNESRGDIVDHGTTSEALPIVMRNETKESGYACHSGTNSRMNFSGISYFVENGDSSLTRPIQASPLSSGDANSSPSQRSQPGCSPSISDLDQGNIDEQCGHVYTRRHRSLVNIFNVFCLIALFGLPFLVINKLACIIHSDGSLAKLISGEIYDLLLLSLIPVAMMFSVRYYDAIFVTTTQNCFSIVVFLSGGIWISSVKLVLPISNLLGFDEMGSNCKINNSYGSFLLYGERAMTPFFTECAIIATGIIWQMWTSFVSRSELHLDREMPRYDAFSVTPSRNLCQTFASFFKSCVAKCRRSGGNEGERRELIPKESPTQFKRYLSKCWLVAITLSLIYFTVNMWLIWDGYSLFPSKTTQQVYFGWFLEVIFYIPFYIFFVHISYVSRGIAHQPVPSHRSLEGHDVLLLLCTCGIFCQAIFRMASGLGLLLSQRASSGDDLATWIYSLMYSVFIIVLIFNLTSFLLRVQRQDPLNPTQMKWVLSFLIYISAANSTEWLIDSIIVESWPVQCQFFGQTTGKVVGTLLDPFATLFGLHAAMVAYESYKVILQRALKQQKDLRHSSLNVEVDN